MSVTFFCPDAPVDTLDCPYCAQQDDGQPCDNFCDGTVKQSRAPEINLGNSNAATLLSAIGEFTVEDLYGTWNVDDLPRIQRAITKALNVDDRVAAMTSETVESRGALGCRMISMGYTDEQVRDRLERFQTLVAYAAHNKLSIHWG